MTQDILITPGSGEPQILFRGSGVNDTAVELNVLSSYQSASGSGTALVFEGQEGQLFAITDNLSSGTIFSVGDITGLSLLSVDASGDVKLGEFGNSVIVYPGLTFDDNVPSTTTNVLYNDGGDLKWNGVTVVEAGASQSVNGSGVAGYIPYWSDGNTLSYDSGQLFWDAANNRLGVGTASPSYTVDVVGNFRTDNIAIDGNSISATNSSGPLVFIPNGAGAFQIGSDGDTRGHFANDLQRYRVSAGYVAAGCYSTIGGGFNNCTSSTALQATVAGGAVNRALSQAATIGGGTDNFACCYATVGGGSNNCAYGFASKIGGGLYNRACASASYSFIGGGSCNTSSGSYAGIVAGSGNVASGASSFIGGGKTNCASQTYSVVIGGLENCATCTYSFGGNGFRNCTSGPYGVINNGWCNSINNTTSQSTITNGQQNCISTNGSWAFIGNGSCNIVAAGTGASIVNGVYNVASGDYAAVVAGSGNIASGACSFVGAGCGNCATGERSSVVGGDFNQANGCRSVVGGGYGNCACGQDSTVSGGYSNLAGSTRSTVGGGWYNCANGGAGYNTVGGGRSNNAGSTYAVVAGGNDNTASAYASTVSGGRNNSAICSYSTVGGGDYNYSCGLYAFVGGGRDNVNKGNYSTITGGWLNNICINANRSSILGGNNNTISGSYSAILGGQNNDDGGYDSVFILGTGITATQPKTTYTQKLYASDTLDPSGTIFNVEGSNGSIFSVVDDLSGALMSVNTIAGLPVLQVNSDYSVTAGRFNQNDFVITASGDVGIGTANPTQKLHVLANSSNAGDNGVFVKDTGSWASVGVQGAGGSDTSLHIMNYGNDTSGSIIWASGSGPMRFSAGDSAVEYMRLHTDGSFGIGTTSPSEKLHVMGGARLQGDATGTTWTNASTTLALKRSGDAPFISFHANAGSRIGYLQFWNGGDSSLNVDINQGFKFRTNNQDRMYIAAGGNVGIGTTSPAGKLDIQQDTTGNLLSRIFNTNNSGTGSTSLRITNLGNNNNGSRLEFSDTNYYVGTITGDRTNGIQFFTGNQNSPTQNVRMEIDPNGNVGIGTTSPAAKLDVNGSVRIDSVSVVPASCKLLVGDVLHASSSAIAQFNGFLRFKSGAVIHDAATIANSFFINYDDSDGLHLHRTEGTGSQNIILAEDGGNVGIGTTSPSEKLHVAGDVQINGTGGTIGLATFDNGLLKIGTSSDGISIDTNEIYGANDLYLGSLNTASSIFFMHGSTARMRIASGGNVGIGTTSPSEKLHVAGNLRLTGAFYDSNNSAGTSGQVLSSTATGTDWISLSEIQGVDGTGTANYLAKWSDTDTIANSLIYDNGTNVGIGTASPSNTLDVKGIVSVGHGNSVGGLTEGVRFVRVNNDNNRYQSIFTASSAVDYGNTMEFRLHDAVGGNTQTTVMTLRGDDIVHIDGSLGIGIGQPSQKLDIRYPAGGGMALLKSTDTNDGLLFGDMAYSVSNNHQGIKHAAMTGNQDYMILSDGTNTWVSAKSGGVTIIAAGGNSADSHMTFSSTEVVINENSSSLDFRVESNNNANMLFVDGVSDKVGIGTGSPVGKLHILQNNANARYSYFDSNLGLFIKGNDNSAYNLLTLENTWASANFGNSINFNLGYGGNTTTAGTSVLGARILAAAEQTMTATTSTQDAYLSFYTTLDGTSSEKLRITSGGNVGIGTTSPASKLHIAQNTTSSVVLKLEQDNASYESYYEALCQDGGYARFGISSNANNSAFFNTDQGSYRWSGAGGGSPSMTLTNGNLGIGTTSPEQKLHVNNGNIKVENPTTPTIEYDDGVVVKAKTYYDTTNETFVLKHNTVSGDEQLVLASGGQVGIGTNAPNAVLHAYGSTPSGTVFNVEGTNGSLFSVVDNLSGVLMSVNNNAGLPVFEVYDDDSIIGGRFAQNDFVVSSSGNVGIGTATPTSKLHVVGDLQVDNLNLNGNTLSSTNTNGNILITPNGNGNIVAGVGHTLSGYCSVIGGGSGNTASVYISPGGNTISGGVTNSATYSDYGTIGGGKNNTASGYYPTIAGGLSNCATGQRPFIGGGELNIAIGGYSVVSGGCQNCASNSNATIAGGIYNCATAASSFIGGGSNNSASALYSTISGGKTNIASGGCSTVSGGYLNVTNARHSIISGGHRNIIQSPTNECCSRGATIGGGVGHNSSGGTLNLTTGDLTGTITCCNAGAFSTIGGGLSNCATVACSTVGGGSLNSTSGLYSTISGGLGNCTRCHGDVIAGGLNNQTFGFSLFRYSVVSGGRLNCAGSYSTVGGGCGNSACNISTIGGGLCNCACGSYSTVSGGSLSTASGSYSTISGGRQAKASKYGEVAHAAGQFAQQGDAQHSILVARRNTTDATVTTLFLDGVDDRLTLPAETTWTFSINLSAYNDTDNTAAWWIIRGGIRRNAANGTALIGSLIEERDSEGTMSGTSVAVTADDTNGALNINVTGLASKNIRWVAVVDISQVSWGTP